MISGDSVTAYTPFQFPISYLDSTTIPDSANIKIFAYTGRTKGASTLVIDKLRFDNPITANIIPHTPEDISLYPNPAQNRVVMEMKNVLEEEGFIQLINMSGQVMTERKVPAKQSRFDLDLTTVANGFYMFHLRSGNNLFNTKLVVIK